MAHQIRDSWHLIFRMRDENCFIGEAQGKGGLAVLLWSDYTCRVIITP